MGIKELEKEFLPKKELPSEERFKKIMIVGEKEKLLVVPVRCLEGEKRWYCVDCQREWKSHWHHNTSLCRKVLNPPRAHRMVKFQNKDGTLICEGKELGKSAYIVAVVE